VTPKAAVREITKLGLVAPTANLARALPRGLRERARLVSITQNPQKSQLVS